MGGGTISIETFAVEYPSTKVDRLKISLFNLGYIAMDMTWTNMFNDLKDQASAGEVYRQDGVRFQGASDRYLSKVK
jgi:hypothetical protein